MAERTPRWLWSNFWKKAGAIIEALSESSALTREDLRDDIPTRVLRSLAGYNVGARFNAAFDFSEGGTARTAFLTPANFATPALYAAHVAAQMNAAGVTPSALSPTGWWRAEEVTGLAHGAQVAQWNDIAGSNRHLTQGTGALQPLHQMRILNGRPAVRFLSDNMGTGVALSTFLGANGVGTIFVVYWIDDDASFNQLALGGGATGTGLKVVAGPSLQATNTDAGGQDTVSIATTLGAWHVGVWMHDATTLFVGNDDADTAALSSVASGATTAGELTGTLALGVTGGTFKGYCAEVVVFNTNLTEENRRRVMRYLTQKYALTDNTTAPAWTNTYAVTHDGTKHTVARSSGAASISLLHSSGKHFRESASVDLGYDASADDTGSTSYLADGESYQSRQWVLVRGLTFGNAQAAEVLGHNLGSLGTVTLYGDPALDAWYNAAFSVELAGDSLARRRIAFFSVQDRAVWAVVLNGVGVSAGYVDVGRVFTGPYLQTGRSYARSKQESSVPITVYGRSEGGAVFGRPRNSPKVQRFRFPRLTRADMEAYQAMEDAMAGLHLTLALDPQNYPGSRTFYGVLPTKAAFDEHVGDGTPPDRYDIEVLFEEDLG